MTSSKLSLEDEMKVKRLYFFLKVWLKHNHSEDERPDIFQAEKYCFTYNGNRRAM
jgi:hypothetical protein